MKSVTTATCMVLLILFAVTGYSQKREAAKPSLFADLPASIHYTEAQLSVIFKVDKGQSIELPVSKNLVLSGVVTSNLVKYSNLQTIVIKFPAFKNTFFSLSKQTDQNNKATYVGRILNPLFTDGFELKNSSNGNYQLVKINTENILVDCNQ